MVWTEVLELEEENGRARLAAEILASDAYQTTMDKVRAFVQLRKEFSCRIVGFQAGKQHLTVAGDNGQQVVEVVRHSTGQSPYRFHLLRLTDLLFQPFSLRYITRDG